MCLEVMFSTQVIVLSLACWHLHHREDEMGPSDGGHHAPELTCNQQHPALVPAHPGGLRAAQCSHSGPIQPQTLNPPSPCATGTHTSDMRRAPLWKTWPPRPTQQPHLFLLSAPMGLPPPPPSSGQARGQGLCIQQREPLKAVGPWRYDGAGKVRERG